MTFAAEGLQVGQGIRTAFCLRHYVVDIRSWRDAAMPHAFLAEPAITIQHFLTQFPPSVSVTTPVRPSTGIPAMLFLVRLAEPRNIHQLPASGMPAYRLRARSHQIASLSGCDWQNSSNGSACFFSVFFFSLVIFVIAAIDMPNSARYLHRSAFRSRKRKTD